MKFLVILHIYYEYMWPELKSYLMNLNKGSYDLVVTLSNDNEELKQEILSFNDKALIILTENRGYDVWPFIKALSKVNLDDYQYLIKLHTKRDLPDSSIIIIDNHYFFKGRKWRQYLLSFISSKANFDKCVETLDNDPSVGMINSMMLLDGTRLNQKFRDLHLKYCIEKAKSLLESIKINPLPNDKVNYIGGTMFMCRASIMKPLLKLNLCADDFAAVQRENENELAHVLERVFGWLVTSQGYRFSDPYTTKEDIKKQLPERIICRIKTFPLRHRIFSKIMRFIIRYDKNNGYREIKIFKIKIFKYKLKDNK